MCFISAPRRVLMRCVARYEVDLTGLSIYFDELPWCPSKGNSISLADIYREETHKCPVGKVPIDHVSLLHPISHSSARHVSSLQKGSHPRWSAFSRGVMRQAGA